MYRVLTIFILVLKKCKNSSVIQICFHLPSFRMVESNVSHVSACCTIEETMPLDEMPLAFSKICRMETRSILTRAIGLRNTSMFEGNSWRPILNGDDVKQRKDLEVTTNVSPLGSVTLLADFFFLIRFNVSAMHWIQGTKVDNCSSVRRSIVEQQTQAPEYAAPLKY